MNMIAENGEMPKSIISKFWSIIDSSLQGYQVIPSYVATLLCKINIAN